MQPTLVFTAAQKQRLQRRQKDMSGDRVLSAPQFPDTKQHAQSLLGGAQRARGDRRAVLKSLSMTKEFNNCPL
jgi:hypothetical protein